MIMEAKEKFEIGQDVYVACLDRSDNEFYYITAKVMDITYGDETTYVCRAYADSKLYNVPEKDVFRTYQEAEEYCKKYTIMKIKTKSSKVELTDFEKLKIAYEVIRDLERGNCILCVWQCKTAIRMLTGGALLW